MDKPSLGQDKDLQCNWIDPVQARSTHAEGACNCGSCGSAQNVPVVVGSIQYQKSFPSKNKKILHLN